MGRIGDVLQALLSEIDEIGGYRSPHMTPDIGGDADAARRGEALEARRDIDAVAVNVVRRHDDVAEIDADAQIDAAVLRQPGVPREDDPLHVQGTAHRFDHIAELDESPAATSLGELVLFRALQGVPPARRGATLALLVGAGFAAAGAVVSSLRLVGFRQAEPPPPR